MKKNIEPVGHNFEAVVTLKNSIATKRMNFIFIKLTIEEETQTNLLLFLGQVSRKQKWP